MNKKGSHKIALRKILTALEIFVMLFELSITPLTNFASITAMAMEEASVDYGQSQEQSVQEDSGSSEAAGQDATPQGNEESQPQDEASAGSGAEDAAPQDGGQDDASAGAGNEQAATVQESQDGGSSDAGTEQTTWIIDENTSGDASTQAPQDEASAGAASQPGDASQDQAMSEGTSSQASSGGSSSQGASGGSSSEAPGSASTQATDAASGASSKAVDDAAAEGSSKGKQDDAATAASSGKDDAAASASSGASTDDAAASASSTEDKEKLEKEKLEKEKLEKEKKEKEEKEKEEKEKEEKKEVEIIEGEIFLDEAFKISFDKDAEIPEGAELVAGDVSDEEFEEYLGTVYEKMELAPEDVAGLRIMEIAIVKDEQEIQPKSEVYLELGADYLFGERALYADDNVAVFHINGEEVEALECEVIGDEEDDDNAATSRKARAVGFSTGSFSPFVIMQLSGEKSASVSGGGYEVTVTYDNTSGIPAGTELVVNEVGDTSGLGEQSAALFDSEVYTLEAIRAFDISFVDRESDEHYQPGKDITVTLNVSEDWYIEGAEPYLIRYDGEASLVEAGVDEQTYVFSAGSLTTYGIAQFSVKKTLTATDGSTYLITVNYDSVSGIPEGAVLSVSEITEEYDEYAEKSAGELDEEPEMVEVVRAFDISFRNPDTGEEYQPTKGVSVSIDLFDEDLEERSEDLDIVHIHGDDEEQAEVVDSAVNDGVVEFETETFSVFVVVRKVIEQTLTASDGQEYLITVSFDSTAGIPQNAELVVNEIKEGEAGYEKYMTEGLEKIDVLKEEVYIAKTFDITLRDPETGIEYQPTKDVKVSIQLLSDTLKAESKTEVIHFGEETQVMEVAVDGQTIEFRTDGFSVYVVINHENGEVVAPRVEFHFIDRYTDAQYTAGIDVTQPTTAAPYNFINTHGEYQTTQIVANGESLELINDPANVEIDNIEKFFYGWYVVTKISDTSTFNSTTGKYEGEVNFSWPDSPKQVKFGQNITITLQDGNGDGKTTVGETLQWTMNGTTGTGTIDRSGTVHVYLAPLYEDFYFINFHNSPRTAAASASSSLMTRKLVVFGSGTTTSVRIGNVICESPDPQHKIFAGWESDLDGDGDYEASEFFQTVQHVLDSEGNIANQEVNNTSANNGYYIDVTKDPGTVAGSYLDLYPVFDEARWLYFNRGKSDNNSSYVGAAYRLTNDNRSTEDTFYYFDNAFFAGDSTTKAHISRRAGYNFKGWYLFANMDENTSQITNLTTSQPVSIDYIDGNGERQTTTINTTAILLIDENGVIQNVGTWYISSTGTISQTQTAGSRKLFEIDATGKLRFYKALNDMTLAAKWVEKPGTYRVIIWKQKVTVNKTDAFDKDDDDIEDKYDYHMFYTSGEVDCTVTPDLTSFSGTYRDKNGSSQTVTNKDLTAENFTGFHYAGVKVYNDNAGTGKPKSDGTTVYSVFYDRDLRAINFYYYSNAPTDARDSYTYNATTGTTGTQYGLVSDHFVPITYNESTRIWTVPVYEWQYQVDNDNGNYGLVGEEYVELTPTYTNATAYALTSSLSSNNQYLIVSRDSSGAGYALGHNLATIVSDSVTVKNGQNIRYIALDDVDNTSVWSVSTSGWFNPDYIFSNGGYYVRRNSSNLQISTTNNTNEWSWDSGNNRLSMSTGGWGGTTYYISCNNGTWSLDTNSSSVYLYVRGTYPIISGYTYDNGGTPTVYTGTRYSYNFVPTENIVEYKATRFTRSSNVIAGCSLVTWSGLYGQTLAQNGYSWDDVSAHMWFEGTSVPANNGTVQTFLDAFIQNDNPYNLATNSNGGTSAIYHYRQQLDGSYTTTDRETAYGSGGRFNFTNKFDGFTVSTYSTGNNGFSPNGGTNSATPGSSTGTTPNYPLHVYHTRNQYTLEFDVNYPIDAGLTYSKGKSSNLIVQNISYEAPLNTYGSSTNEGITNWYYGVVNSKNTADHELVGPDHYVFSGWYEDQSGIVPFNFNSTMPAANKIVYALWEPEKFIIRVDPNGGELDHVNHTGYAGLGSRTVTIDGQSYTFDFTTINTNYSPKYPLPGTNPYNDSALQTYIRASYGTQLDLYDPARRFVAMSDRVAAEYSGTIYYYVNWQWRATDGESGISKDIRSALYLTEDQVDDFYDLYRNIVIYSKGDYPTLNKSMALLDKDTWKALYVAPEKYREKNNNETWAFLGWFKTPINEDGSFGTEESMPYNVNDPVTGNFKLTAHWRLDGGYSIEYVPKYTMDDGAQINGTMASWRDPINSSLTYADGADTEIYKAPTGLTKNGETITDDSVIFRGWALVSRTGTAPNYVYTPLETDTQGNINTYYFPSDDYVVNAANAGADSTIYLQAIYQYKNSSDRRPKVTNLTLDSNSDAYVNTTDSNTLPKWDYPGTQAINTVNNLDYQGRPKQILFGDIQSSAAVHLYKYATEITQTADGTPLADAHQFFTHSNGYFLLGFDDSATEADYIATYPADSVIAITRDDNKTIYGVWEPMVYVTFVNNTGVTANNVTFGLQSASNEALQVINIRDGLYDRRPLASYNAITLANGESITLAFPKGAEKTITISGTNTLGVGKKLLWNSSIDLVENGTTTSYTTVNSTTGFVDYSHTASGSTHSHRLVSGEVNNTRTFSFNEDMIVNQNALTVTFTSANNDYALLLDDNYTGGGMQEYDYSLEEIQPDANNVPKTQYLPTTSTRIGFSFVGWAYSPTATEADFSASKPTSSPWTIPDLNKDDGFFSVVTDMDGVLTRTLYAVWEAKTDKIYVYKEVPEPGNQKQAFTFNVSITGTYKYGNSGSSSASINESHSFKLVHGEYLRIGSSKFNPTSGRNQTAYVQAEVEVYYPVTNSGGTTSYVKDDSRSYTVRWQLTDLRGYNTNKFDPLRITVTEPTTTYYDTSVTLSSELNDRDFTIGSSSYDKTQLPQTVPTNTVYWTNTDAGGTMVFVNQRQTYDVKVTKTLESNTSAQSIFNYTAVYTDSYTNIAGTTVSTTSSLNPFTVTSGSFTTLRNIPAGIDLTITEATDTDDNYETYCKVDNGTEIKNKVSSTFTVGVNPKDSANKTHEVAYRNVLKSYNVVFKLVDQNGNTTINGVFALSSEYGSLGAELYASNTGSNPGVFYTSSKFYVGTYKLSQSVATPKYLKLNGEVTLKVTGRDGITCADDNVTITGNANDGYVVTIRNLKTADITLKSGLLDPMVDQRTFVYTGTYKFEGKTYDLNRKLLENGVSPDPITLTAYSTNDGSVSPTQLPKTFAIPIGATELTFREDVTQVTVAPDTIATTYDTTVQRNSEERIKASVFTYSSAIVDGNDGNIITFYNSKKTVEIKVKKIVETDDTSGKFAFTATLLNGTKKIAGYPIHDKNGTPTDPSDDDMTNAEGEFTFELKGFNVDAEKGIIALNIPVGAKLTIQETGVSEHTSGNNLNLFATTAVTTLTEGGTVYDGDGKTTYVEKDRLYTLITAPSSKLTVTFTNGPSGQEIKFIKRDGFGKLVTGDTTNGPKFQLFTSATCAPSDVFTLPDGTSVIGIPDANGVVQLKSDATAPATVTEKVPYGVYYMKEVKVPDKYDDEELPTYVVLVGQDYMDTSDPKHTGLWTGLLSNIRATDITGQTTTYKAWFGNDYEGYAIFLIDSKTNKAVITPDIAAYGILNISTATRKVILKKTDGTYGLSDFSSIDFEVLRYDLSPVESTDKSGNESTVFECGNNNVYFIDELPYGTYYIQETVNSTTKYWFTLTVDKNGVNQEPGVTVSGRSNSEPVPPTPSTPPSP